MEHIEEIRDEIQGGNGDIFFPEHCRETGVRIRAGDNTREHGKTVCVHTVMGVFRVIGKQFFLLVPEDFSDGGGGPVEQFLITGCHTAGFGKDLFQFHCGPDRQQIMQRK